MDMRKELLSSPSVAHSVSLPASLSMQIVKFVHLGGDDLEGLQFEAHLQRASTIVQLQQLRKTLPDSPVCFYPCGGADGFYPALLSNAKITVLTGVEPWGGLEDVGRALNFEKTAEHLGGMWGGFDSKRDWGEGTEDLGFNTGTLGPLSIIRAIAAQTLNGEPVSSLKISAFDIDENSQLQFSAPKPDNANNDNVAFWLTNSEGHSKLYLYYRLRVEESAAPTKIANLHGLLSRISDKGQTLFMEKGIPSDLYRKPNIERLLSPPAMLIKAVICDTYQHKDHSQPVFLGDTVLKQTTVVLDKVGTERFVNPKFGYGDRVFVHTPSSGRLNK